MRIHLGLVLFALLAYGVLAQPSPGTHHVTTCIKIGNLEDFPDYHLYGVQTGPLVKGVIAKKIVSNVCIGRVSELNNITVFAVEINYVTSQGGAGRIDYFNDNNVHQSNLQLNPNGRFVPNDDKIFLEEIIYTISDIGEGTLHLFKSRTTSKYIGDSTPVVKVFVEPTAQAFPEPAPEPVADVPQSIVEPPIPETDEENEIERLRGAGVRPVPVLAPLPRFNFAPFIGLAAIAFVLLALLLELRATRINGPRRIRSNTSRHIKAGDTAQLLAVKEMSAEELKVQREAAKSKAKVPTTKISAHTVDSEPTYKGHKHEISKKTTKTRRHKLPTETRGGNKIPRLKSRGT